MIAWTDIESSGLFEREGHLLEVAVVITDDDLNEIAHISHVVRPVGADIDGMFMDAVVREMHTVNGLLAELRAGGGMRRHEAEIALINFLTNPVCGMLRGEVVLDVCVNCKKKQGEHRTVHLESTSPGDGLQGAGYTRVCAVDRIAVYKAKIVPLISQVALAGSTVAFDRRWLREHMPKLEVLFSYRSIDVSALTELARRWAPKVYENRPKANKAHRALADVRESIAYLRYYRDAGFVGGGNWT